MQKTEATEKSSTEEEASIETQEEEASSEALELVSLKAANSKMDTMISDMVANIAMVERENKELKKRIEQYKSYFNVIADHMRKIGFELASVRDSARKQAE